MRRLHQTVLSLALAAAAAGGSTGCGARPGASGDKAGSATAEGAGKNGDRLRVGMVFDVGGRGDKSFNDSAYSGLEMAKKELGIEFELIEPADAADRESGLRLMAGRDFDLIVAVGFIFTDEVTRIAREFPDRRFACVDYAVEPGKENEIPFNLRALLFRDEEGTFLAGAVAGYCTKTGRIGFVGGMDTPIIRRFERGFTLGVAEANPRAQVVAKYAGITPEAFKNPARGKELALGLYDEGCDIIFHASGSTGLGVFEAARERRKLVIGVDADQWDEAPGLVLTSMVKHVDRAVLETVRAVSQGVFSGGITRMGLMSGGIELIFDERNDGLVPKDVHGRVDRLRHEVMSRRLEIPVDRPARKAPGI